MHPTDEEPPPVVYDTNEYEVKRLLSHKKVRGASQFLVEWEGYPRHMATWEPAFHISTPLIKAYWKRQRKEATTKRELLN